MIYIDLLIGFLEVGFLSFGGGYAAIPLIRDVVLSYGWLDEEMLTYMVAVSESSPGPIMVNMATYVGSLKGGILGAVIATVAVVLPAFLIILLIMVLLRKLLQNRYMKAALGGMKPCIIGIILTTGFVMMLRNCGIFVGNNPADILTIILTCGIGVIYFGSRKILKKGISPIGLIGLSAIVGAVAYGI